MQRGALAPLLFVQMCGIINKVNAIHYCFIVYED